MSSVVRPQGRLPARVYWVRRLVLVVLVALLVVGVQRLLTSESSTTSEEKSPAAASVVGAPFDLPTLSAVPSGSPGMVVASPRRKAKLPRPDGPCDAADVTVTPVIESAHIGRPVQIILELTTTESEACTFEVSAATVAVNVSTTSSARELLWTSQDCPVALAETTVVARQEVPGRAVAEWTGRRSEGTCSSVQPFVVPGRYLAEAVALGGTETGSLRFRLGSQLKETITRTVTPTPTASPSAGR